MSLVFWDKVFAVINYLDNCRYYSTATYRHVLRKIKEIEQALMDALDCEPQQQYFIISAIIYYCDEIMNNSGKQLAQYATLQERVYQEIQGGSKFFSNLEEVLATTCTKEVYQVYYLVLLRGFCGKFKAEPQAIEEYLHRIDAKI